MKSITTLLSVALISMASFFSAAQASELGYELGTEYKKTAEAFSTAPFKKSVIEIFGYHCPHCYHLEPSLHAWEKSKSESVNFEQVPAVFNSPNWIFMARVYYTGKVLGVLKQSHKAYFDALHRDNKKLYDLDSIAQFFTQFDVTEEKFKDTFRSFQVEQLVRKAQKITAQAGIEGVPAVVINGKYLTDVGMAGSRSDLWKLVDHLTDK